MTSSTPGQEAAKYVESTPTSRELQGEAEHYLPGGSSRGTAYFAPYPIFIERGEGHYITMWTATATSTSCLTPPA